MCNVRARFVWVCLFLIASFIVGCSPKSTPPGASSIGGGVDVARFSYHYWEEGLSILIWHDLSYGGEGCSGTGSTEDPVYRLECDVESADGQTFSWKVHTRDGVTAELWIEDQSYDPSQGNMFLVSSKDDGIQVDQLHRDFSELEPNVETISALSNSDPDVAGFIARIGTVSDSPDADNKDGLAAFNDALQLAGQTVEIAGPVDQPFFSVPGQIIVVNGEDVQVFEYPDSAAAEAEASRISPDASSVGTSMMSWVATPHFYALDRVIVLYVGDDQAVVNVLNEVLGQPIAEGQGVPLLLPDTATLLSDAFAAADYEALQGLMGETFAIGYWLSEGQTLTPVEAVEQLRLNLLPDPAGVSFIRDRGLFPDLSLGGVDPTAVFGPDMQIVDLVYSQGWGADGLQEAILAIAQNPDGSQYWHGILYGRFAELPGPPVQEPTLDEKAGYRNAENGFELLYPASWHLDEQVLGSRASGALFYVTDTDEEPIFSAVVYLWDPKNDLDAWLEQRRQSWSGSGATVLSEEELTVTDGHRAIQFELQWVGGQTTNYMFMEVGERYLELFGSGDLENFGEIIATLRFVESGS